jgi:hypothetical protein
LSHHTFTGGKADVVDLRIGFFCIASNYSRRQELRLQWNQFDTIVRQGEQHAREVLEQQAAGAAAPPA